MVRGGELKCYRHTYRHTYRASDEAGSIGAFAPNKNLYILKKYKFPELLNNSVPSTIHLKKNIPINAYRLVYEYIDL